MSRGYYSQAKPTGALRPVRPQPQSRSGCSRQDLWSTRVGWGLDWDVGLSHDGQADVNTGTCADPEASYAGGSRQGAVPECCTRQLLLLRGMQPQQVQTLILNNIVIKALVQQMNAS